MGNRGMVKEIDVSWVVAAYYRRSTLATGAPTLPLACKTTTIRLAPTASTRILGASPGTGAVSNTTAEHKNHLLYVEQ